MISYLYFVYYFRIWYTAGSVLILPLCPIMLLVVCTLSSLIGPLTLLHLFTTTRLLAISILHYALYVSSPCYPSLNTLYLTYSEHG